jgi:RNA polymerase sigma-70 factor, ECF subfamily
MLPSGFSPRLTRRKVASVSDSMRTMPGGRDRSRTHLPRITGEAEGAPRAFPVVSVDRVDHLVALGAQGDREAFGELYRILHPKVFRLARFHLGTRAEDAVSETFARAWAALPSYRQMGTPFAAWLYGIARHVVADQLAKQRREVPRPQIPDGIVQPDPDERLILKREIERLPPVQRYVIEGKFLVGLSNGEMASALGRSPGAINALQWRALRTLQRRLGER